MAGNSMDQKSTNMNVRSEGDKSDNNVAGPSNSIHRYSLRRRGPVEKPEDEMETDPQIPSNDGQWKRTPQPDALINPHLKKIKMECDYVPIPEIKKEPGSEEEEGQIQPSKDKNESCSQSSEMEGHFKGVLNSLLTTLEAHLISTQLVASKIPSRRNLALKIQKVLEDLDTEFKGTEESQSNDSNVQEAESEGGNEMDEANQVECEELSNPLLNEKIFNSILKYLDTNSLKSCRLVSKFWNVKASIILFENQFIRVPSDIHSEFNSKTEEEKIVIIDEMKERFSRFNGIISNIIINNPSDVNVFSGLELLGEQVENIKINLWTADCDTYSPVLDTIVQSCPNLNYLDFVKKKDEIVSSDVKSFFGLALMKACNKHQVQNKADADRPFRFTVSGLHVNFGDNDNDDCIISMFEKFAELGVQVNDLTIAHNKLNVVLSESQLAVAINKILKSSKDNMVKFTYNADLSILHEIKIPVMSKLLTLEISMKDTWYLSFFHPDFRFSEHVPKLQTICLQLDLGYSSRNSDPLASAGPAPRVKKLHYSNVGYFSKFDAVLKHFTQLEELSCSRRKDLSQILKICDKLKKLTLFSVDLNSKGNCVTLLTKLIGIKEKDAEKLVDSSKEIDSINITQSRKRPSVLDLKDLQFLTLKQAIVSGPNMEYLPKFSSLLRKLFSVCLPELRFTVDVEEDDKL